MHQWFMYMTPCWQEKHTGSVVITYMQLCNSYKTLGSQFIQKKSSFVPSQEIIFLFFAINTQHMKIPLTNEKKVKIHEYAKKLLVGTPSITEIVKFLGNLSSSFESVTYGRLFLGSKKLIKKMH